MTLSYDRTLPENKVQKLFKALMASPRPTIEPLLKQWRDSVARFGRGGDGFGGGEGLGGEGPGGIETVERAETMDVT